MQCRIADFRCKEVINVCDGNRLGFVEDVLVELPCGKIVAIIVPGPCRYLGFFGREIDFVIPWDCIVKIGEDIILAEVKGEHKKVRKERGGWV